MPTNSEYCNESKRVTYDEILTIEKPYTVGYLFHGFYTEPNGQGEQICDENCQFKINFFARRWNGFYKYLWLFHGSSDSTNHL